MDEFTRDAELGHGRPAGAHATQFETMRADIKGEALA
jgi:hypothetical protein